LREEAKDERAKIVGDYYFYAPNIAHLYVAIVILRLNLLDDV